MMEESDAEGKNISSQIDELEALSAIYGEDFIIKENQSFDLRICCDDEKWWAVTISVLLPSTYPKTDPPLFEIFTECLSHEELESIYKELGKIWNESDGENILYAWVEKIREMLFEQYERAKLFIESSEEDKQREKILTDLMRETNEMVVEEKIGLASEEVKPTPIEISIPEIISGDTVTVKKSSFQGHVAIVHTLQEVKAVLRKLKENRKVSQATHNIVAYRLSGVNETSFIQDYADDGEVNAGGRLLHLLQIMDVKNIVVIVSRWFGGVLLGPDRFRLINNCARDVITISGAYTPKQEKQKAKKKR